MPRRRTETPAEALDTYAFDFGTYWFDDDDWCGSDCPCQSEIEVEKLCAEDAPELPAFANRPRITCPASR